MAKKTKPAKPAKQADTHRPWQWIEGRKDQFFYGLIALCAVLFLADLIYKRKSAFELEGLIGFFPLIGFIIAVFLILSAYWVRQLLGRDETYYGDKGCDAENMSLNEAGREMADD